VRLRLSLHLAFRVSVPLQQLLDDGVHVQAAGKMPRLIAQHLS